MVLTSLTDLHAPVAREATPLVDYPNDERHVPESTTGDAVRDAISMPKFTVNAYRFDPYKGFKFRVLWDGRPVAGISHMSALTRRTDVVEFREGGDPSMSHKSAGKTTYAPIVLARGLTHELEFERWAKKVWSLSNAQ